MVSRRAFLAGAAWLFATPATRGLASSHTGGEPPWQRLRQGGLVLLMRHASTQPGLGDPPGYRLDDCRSQRNLSPAGLEEARRVGEKLRSERVPIGRVYSSPWCRCRDTAIAAFGRAEDWEPLSSIFDFPERERDFSERVRKRIGVLGRKPSRDNVVMVTHNVNIAALTRHSVAPCEIVVVRPDGCCGLRPLERVRL
ncbi:MAG TPA: histidine phosphatase family protein [Usitatibacter sp.]|nr:histidine phosphatase family protein [Usitatibacter sp.]